MSFQTLCDSEKNILAQTSVSPYFSVLGPLGCTWIRHYCTYEKGSKTFSMSNTEAKSAGKQVVFSNSTFFFTIFV